MSELLECDAPDCYGGFHPCFECDGDGYLVADCEEDSCCCLNPEAHHRLVTCDNCFGVGGWPCPV